MRWIALSVVAILFVPSLVTADTLWDQAPNGGSVADQDFTDIPSLSIQGFDDVLVPSTGWTVSQVTIHGTETGNPLLNQAVLLGFYSAPDEADLASPLFTGTEVGADLVFNLPDVPLAAGPSWVSAWVQRPAGGGGGQWFWDTSTPVQGNESMVQNPNGGWGLGSGAVTTGLFLSSNGGSPHPPQDLAFTIEGQSGATPELPPVALLSALPIGLAWLRRRPKR